MKLAKIFFREKNIKKMKLVFKNDFQKKFEEFKIFY
jgi:hypothetical protein